MSTTPSLRILIDNSVLSLSDTMQGVVKKFKSTLDAVQSCNIFAYERRPSPKESEAWKGEQISCLPTIARLAREGRIQMHSTPELGYEALRRPGSFPSNIIGQLFADIHIEELNTPIERSRFFQLPIEEHLSTKLMVQFCKWLLEVDGERLAKSDRIQTSCSEFEINNLMGLGRYRELCRGLGEGQYLDAFHLWSAELHKISHFLTVDKKFIRAITTNKKLKSTCLPISPSDLLDLLDVVDRDPFPYDHRETISVFNRPL